MTDLRMTERPGFTGKLNGKILERVRFLAGELQIPDLESKFPHLKVTDGSWRPPLPGDDVNLAAYIDHTQLKQEAPKADIVKLCEEAKQYKFYAVCVNSSRVKLCVEKLRGTGIKTGASCGFPLGACSTATKVAEAKTMVQEGAEDMDMVLNVGALKDKDYRYVLEDIKAVLAVCPPHVTTKVIFETCLLTEEEIIDCAIISVVAGASFVKTSTGFNSGGGATPEAIDVMLAVVGKAAKVKASGGVRDRFTALQYVKAGVSRLGTSSSIAIVTCK
ncbi:putative deoxyribose-phosphate aldolase [Trypanosoma cruzi]|uniref:deoxyribose-phosphate aldolase n=2 Tax=Trypanosoma cruzi TaxID=5693 RepID=Q4DAG5_TRYCC|nr:deoxyribose-phosphate aldolase, putative [Trypanosoma cruzi]EAN89520.1 deoxyribose-phosphate aldolase, putative [Trypanosoma cruzi]PWV08961.1 putative deoxyribose-phosphate aldolase [Trypanosoma cruzi]RNC53449.1 deoxyribose-phosphate aldolase [Trypanosoma cruzi]|eukprot:XP_811371.1 deoxyribose-phosphate aldolase [Trypanosoma cruzi strain CL Brener]